QAGDVTTVFASPSAFGPGGADPSRGCLPDALRTIAPEGPFRLAPQAELTATDGYEPIDATGKVVRTGVDFDAATYVATTPPRPRCSTARSSSPPPPGTRACRTGSVSLRLRRASTIPRARAGRRRAWSARRARVPT